jgi:general secretion pathway protein B
MSILLEALRKSEKNQRSHEAPTIHSDDQAGSTPETLPTIPLVLLLVAALFTSGWFIWRQYQAPAGAYQPPVTLPEAKSQQVSKPVVADSGAPADLPADTSTKQSRTPVESYQPPEDIEQAPATAGTQATPDQAARVSEPGVNPETTAGPRNAANEAVTEPGGTSANIVDAGDAAPQPEGRARRAEIAAEKFHPGDPEPISYWELPDAVRSDIPVIKFSVLVYATDPADRFVLINGQRLGEGDSAQPGLVVKEIRRDGVIFSYRLYQFLVEK